MASSRPIIQQTTRRADAGAAPENAKITAAAADGKSPRRVLGDIGNIDIHCCVDPKKISRPPLQDKEAALLSRKEEAKAFTKAEKTKESIIDIDAGDVENELAVVEYIEDMHKFYRLDEKENRVQDYIHLQPEITETMRAALVDWIIEIHQNSNLTMEILYLTINIVDRYLSLQVTPMKELQLVGMGAMLMASKYELQIWALGVDDFVEYNVLIYS